MRRLWGFFVALGPVSLPLCLSLLAIAAAVSSSCSSMSSTSDGAPATAQLPACSWPASLDPIDAASGQCRGAARAVLSCVDPGGAGEICLSNDLAGCPDRAGSAAGSSTCQDLCNAGEYGIICGAVGPVPEVQPPSGCRSRAPTPAGVVFYCCPCGSAT
jgi:hypothetical protein